MGTGFGKVTVRMFLLSATVGRGCGHDPVKSGVRVSGKGGKGLWGQNPCGLSHKATCHSQYRPRTGQPTSQGSCEGPALTCQPRLRRKLVEGEQKYNDVKDSMQHAAAEYKEVLSQYDLEFEEKGQQMSDKLQQVSSCYRLS